MENNELSGKIFTRITLGVIAVWIIVQIVLIINYWGAPQFTDMGDYIAAAQYCFNHNEWYPMPQDIHTDFIWAPGHINYLILQMHIFGTTNMNSVLNLLFNIAMLFEVYYLAAKFFSKRTGYIAVIVFCSLISNLFIVLGANTENPFVFLCMTALCLVFSGKLKYIILASGLFAMANWVRPLVIVYLFVILVYFIFSKTKIINYIALFVPYIIILLLIGAITEKKTGFFINQSTTMGINLIQVANDEAAGTSMRHNSSYFIENRDLLTFKERDSVWKKQAFQWILNHPAKYLSGYLIRIPGMYFHDNWAIMSHTKTVALWEYLVDESNEEVKNQFMHRIRISVLRSITYYLTLFFFFYALWINRKTLLNVKTIFPVIVVTGTLATCIFAVQMRLHYPYMFAIIIYAACGLDNFIEKRMIAWKKS